jgi:hypothetical protein
LKLDCAVAEARKAVALRDANKFHFKKMRDDSKKIGEGAGPRCRTLRL